MYPIGYIPIKQPFIQVPSRPPSAGASSVSSSNWLISQLSKGISACERTISMSYLVGGIPTPLKNDGVKVSWDGYSQLKGKKKHV